MSEGNIRYRRKEEKTQPKNQSDHQPKKGRGGAWKTIAKNIFFVFGDNKEPIRLTYVPRAFVNSPHSPVRARGEQGGNGLTVFEVKALNAVLLTARINGIAKARREAGWRGGGVAIDRYKPNKRRRKHNHAEVTEGFAAVGSDAYQEAYKAFKLDGLLIFTISRSRLLDAATMMGRRSRNFRLLKSALERLQNPVVDGLPPLITALEMLPNGDLRLTIPREWLLNGDYAKIPWPLPERGPIVMMLFLFLFGCCCRDGKAHDISLAKLCRRIGIAETRSWDAKQQLEQALAGVNEHLHELEGTGWYQGKFPERFTLKRIGERVSFVPKWAHKDDDEADGSISDPHGWRTEGGDPNDWRE
jgi:hypothetical protein